MLSRAPGNLPRLIISQTTSSPLATDSNKRFCKAWPSSGRADSLFEPTSVLDIRSPSPSSTLSSSFAGSHEGGLGSIESGAVVVSGLFCEAGSEGHLPERGCPINANEGSGWAIAKDNGSGSEEDVPLGTVAVSCWHGNTHMAGELNGHREQFSLCQGTSFAGAQENVEGPFSGMNAAAIPPARDILVGNRVGATSRSSAICSSTGVVAQAKRVQWVERDSVDNSEKLKLENLEQFLPPISTNVSVGGSKEQVGQEVMNGDATGRLEGCVIPFYQAETGRNRDQGDFLGEVVQQSVGGSGVCGVGGRGIVEEEWMPDCNDLHVGLGAGEKTATQFGGMEDWEVLLETSAPPAQEWWLPEGVGEDPPVILQQQAQPSHIYQQLHAPAGGLSGHSQFRIFSQIGGGGASSVGTASARRQLDLHEAMQAGLLVSSASSPTCSPDAGGNLPCHLPATAYSPNGFFPSPSTFSSIQAALPRSNSAPLASPIDFSSFTLPSHHLATHVEASPWKLQHQMSLPSALQHLRQPNPASSLFRPFMPEFLPAASKLDALPQNHPSPPAAVLSTPDSGPGFNSSFFHPQFPHEPAHLPSERLSRSQLCPLPCGPPKPDQFRCSPKTSHRVQDAEFFHKDLQIQVKTEAGCQAPRQRSEELFHRLVKSPPPSHDCHLPHIQLPESRCVGRKGLLDELQLAATQLALAADASEKGNTAMAQAILARLNQQNHPKLQPSQRAVFHFKEAIAKRVAGFGSSFHPPSNSIEVINKINAYKSFCEISPLAQFAHFTANQAILEAMEVEDHVHLIDFELDLGGQWASFMQELSQRSRGPPSLRISTVGTDTFEMQLTKESLYQFAKDLNIPLEFNVLPVESLTSTMVLRDEMEALAVNLGGGLDNLLSNFSSVESFVQFIRGLSPKVVTVVDNEGQSDGSSPILSALQFYTCVFESLECSKLPIENVLNIETFLFAPKIAGAVSGRKRAGNWRSLLHKAGFNPSTFSNAAERQAQYLTGSPNTGFTFDKSNNNILLGWHNKPLLSVSAWMC